MFIAANVETKDSKSADNPDKSLVRYEWFEVLIRIANEKYKRYGEADTFTKALDMLVQENVIPYRNDDEWQGFRDKHLWCMDVNDVYEANLETLKKIYEQMKIFKGNKHVIFADINNFFCSESEIQVNDKDVVKAFGMSKMTVVDETDDGEKKYDRLYFVEFLEFLGRVAF